MDIQNFSGRGYAIMLPLERKVSLPVSSSSYTYAHFKHVSGIPVPGEVKGVKGVTISRLKIIDVLIEQLNNGKKTEDISASSQAAEAYIDGLIEQCKNERKQMNSTSQSYSAKPKELTGALFDVAS